MHRQCVANVLMPAHFDFCMNFIFLVLFHFYNLFRMEYEGKLVEFGSYKMLVHFYERCSTHLLVIIVIPTTNYPRNSINQRKGWKVLHLKQHLVRLLHSGHDSMMHTKFEQFKKRSQNRASTKERGRAQKNRGKWKTRNEWIILWLFLVTFLFYSVFRLQNANGSAVCVERYKLCVKCTLNFSKMI